MPLPSWLQPTDVLGAISAGTNAGLRLRQVGDEEDNQANANSLAQQQIAARTQQTQAAMALRGQQASALKNYRQQQIADQKARIADAEAKQTAAATLQSLVQDDTTGFLQDVSDSGAAAALKKHPHADKKFVMEALTQENKDKAAKNKVGEVPYANVTSENKMFKGWHMRMDDPNINAIMGTNAPPGVGTNYNAASALRQPDAPGISIDTSAAPPPSGTLFGQQPIDLGAPPESPYKAPADVKAAVQKGTLTRDAAKKILQDQFGFDQ